MNLVSADTSPKKEEPILNNATEFKSKSLEMVRPKRSGRRAAWVVAMLIVLAIGVMFVPWQQSVAGSGQIIVYSAMERPQTIEAPIAGRLVEWNVQEGDVVKAGDVLGRIEDIDSKFLDQGQVTRTREQRDFVVQSQTENQQRVAELKAQRGELSLSREAAISAARQAIEQAKQRERASRELVIQAEKSFRIAKQVATRSAAERANQAEDRVVQSEQALTAAKQNAETMKLRRDRIAALEARGLRSGQDLELAENEFVKATTDVARAEKALEIARRDVNVGNLAQDQVGLEVERAQAAVEQAKANLAVAERDVVNATLNLNRIQNDTAAQLSRVSADIQSALESMAKNGADVQKVENDLANLEIRTGQQRIVAPASGRVSRLDRVGAGAVVKAGDSLALIVPDTSDRAVEIFVSDNDIPLLEVGRPVRLQFAGWPALQFSGFPSVAVGTFGGRISVIDPVDDGLARYRVIVQQDRHRLPSGKIDPPWPAPHLIRPGAEAAGWVMLDTVPLGFELWRQFNGFPPRAPQKPPLMGKKDAPGEAKEKKSSLGPIKLKSK